MKFILQSFVTTRPDEIFTYSPNFIQWSPLQQRKSDHIRRLTTYLKIGQSRLSFSVCYDSCTTATGRKTWRWLCNAAVSL